MPYQPEVLKPYFNRLKELNYNEDADLGQNIQLAYEYLSGRQDSLPQFNPCYRNFIFSDLTELLSLHAEWGNKERMLIMLLNEPAIWARVEKRVYEDLLNAITQQHSGEVVEKLILFFKTVQVPHEQMIRTILYNFPADVEISGNNRSPLTKYMHLQVFFGSDCLLHSISGSAAPWNTTVFKFLAISKPERAESFVRERLKPFYGSYIHVAETVLAWDYNRYLPLLEEVLNYTTGDPKAVAEFRFELQLTIYHLHKGKRLDSLISDAEAYLQAVLPLMSAKAYSERNIQLEALKREPYQYASLSSCAIYYIAQQDSQRALYWLSELDRHGPPMLKNLLQFVHETLKAHAVPFLLSSLHKDTSEYYKKEFYATVLDMLGEHPGQQYLDELWKLDSYKSKLVRNLVSRFLVEADEQADVKAIPFLDHKKAEIRLAAVMILNATGTAKAQAALKNALSREQSDDARDAILQGVGSTLYATIGEEQLEALVDTARQRGKLSSPFVDWLDEEALPPVFLQSGRALSQEELRFLIYRMSRVKGMHSDIEARPLLNLLDRERSAEFSKKILKLFAERGYDVKFKFLLALAALTGNQELVDKLRPAINEWIAQGRKVMAEHGIGALAILGSHKALRWVEWYARKYRSKKAYVGETARQALQQAAAELGISMNELGDLIVPDFGFEGLFKGFKVNDESYRAFIDSNFKLAYFNEDNKKLKSLPGATPKELKEEFKEIAKEVRDIVRSQSIRMEHYLVVQRQWSFDAWEKAFLQNPVMFIYATRLLWGEYQQGQLINIFLCQEDTSLTDLNDEEISIAEDSRIVMVHPYFLSHQVLDLWKQKFFELAIEPIFPQLERSFTKLSKQEEALKIINSFVDKAAADGAIRSSLEKLGWGKGQAADGGYLEEFFLDHYELGIQAVLEVEGVCVAGFDNDYDPKLGRLYFLDKKVKAGNNSWFNRPKNEQDPRLIPLQQLPAVFYSEVLANVQAIRLKQA